MKGIVLTCLVFLHCSFFFHGFSQVIPSNSFEEGRYRSEQLLGKADPSVSFMVRPAVSYTDTVDYLFNERLFDRDKGFESYSKNAFTFRLLPVNWNQQYLSHQPYGWNDGALIPARGYQTMISAGVFAKYGPLSVQLKPEFVYAENKNFSGFPVTYPDNIWSTIYSIYFNRADLPERFGTSAYHKFNPGQSSIRLTFDPLSIGISNENLWWGPGIKNSLLMSTNAAGFKHIVLNTSRPVRTPIGSFEAQIVAGRLDSSGYAPPDVGRTYNGAPVYEPKEQDWRYLSGIALSYHPKWINGLFLGIARSFTAYNKDVEHSLTGYFPFITPFRKEKVGAVEDDFRRRDQLTSIFARWVFEPSHAEIYGEFGRNDHSVTSRDFVLEPQHSSAVTAGLTKIFQTPKYGKSYVRANFEITSLINSKTYLLRLEPDWYLHYQVRHGYTNKGEILGAGIGPGGSSQSMDLSWSGWWSFGLQFERWKHNADFYRQQFGEDYVDHSWIDHAVGVYMQRPYKGMYIHAALKAIRSSNYQYQDFSHPINVKGELGIMYFWDFTGKDR